MNYHVNPSVYCDSFVLPNDVVRKHIKLIGVAQLKVLLWIFSNGGKCDDINAVSNDIGLPATEIVDAMQYWIVNEIIISDDATVKKDSVKHVKETKIPKISITSQKPDRKEALQRANESADVKWLLDEASSRFARNLSPSEIISLVWMHDTLGMPSEVLLMAIQYSFSLDKCNIRYIEKVTTSWLENDIDTVEKAESYLKESEKSKKNWYTVSKAFGLDKRIPSAKEQKLSDCWINEWKFSSKMLKEAYDSCVDSTGKLSFSYINSVLENWKNNKVKSVEDIAQYNESRKGGKKSKKNKNERSYDISQINSILNSEE